MFKKKQLWRVIKILFDIKYYYLNPFIIVLCYFSRRVIFRSASIDLIFLFICCLSLLRRTKKKYRVFHVVFVIIHTHTHIVMIWEKRSENSN